LKRLFIYLLANSLVEWTSVFETFFIYLFILCEQIFSFYTVQILTFADDSSLTLKATKFILLSENNALNRQTQALHDITGQLITIQYKKVEYFSKKVEYFSKKVEYFVL